MVTIVIGWGRPNPLDASGVNIKTVKVAEKVIKAWIWFLLWWEKYERDILFASILLTNYCINASCDKVFLNRLLLDHSQSFALKLIALFDCNFAMNEIVSSFIVHVMTTIERNIFIHDYSAVCLLQKRYCC